MRIPVGLDRICREEALRYLGWKGECRDERVLAQLGRAEKTAIEMIEPVALIRRFPLEHGNELKGTLFSPLGTDVSALLAGCGEAALMAATLGAQSERLLLRAQAASPADALVLDAVLTAAIEQVCDAACRALEEVVRIEGRYPTRRFSPGYGDMPLCQSAEICAVLNTPREIGLTVSASGLMIPRKSVTAIMGLSPVRRSHLPSGCAACRMADRCQMKKSGAPCARTEE